MYQLNDKQIDYIFNDISARGVELESLQQNLVDHVCCIIEKNLEANGDFESFYKKTIKTFYKDALWEIEEETILLLTFNNYYTMKKIMIISGTVSASILSLGIFFKFMHWPGASFFILIGIVVSSLVFLPLLFTLKAKEKQTLKDKLILGLATVSGILISLAVLFKIFHWPGANMLGLTFVIIMLVLYIPLYFFSGIKNPDAKINTVVTTLIMIMGCGLFLTLINTRPYIQDRSNEISNQALQDSYVVITEQNAMLASSPKASLTKDSETLIQSCNRICDKIEGLKLQLIKETEDTLVKTINFAELGRLDNYDISSYILFKNQEDVPQEKEELLKLKADLAGLNKLSDKPLFDLTDKKDQRTGGTLSWEVNNFWHTPLSNILRNLTVIQLKIRYIQLNNIK